MLLGSRVAERETSLSASEKELLSKSFQFNQIKDNFAVFYLLVLVLETHKSKCVLHHLQTATRSNQYLPVWCSGQLSAHHHLKH